MCQIFVFVEICVSSAGQARSGNNIAYLSVFIVLDNKGYSKLFSYFSAKTYVVGTH